MSKQSITWYKKDLETIKKGLEALQVEYETAMHNDVMTEHNQNELEQELVRVADMAEHIDWLLKREVAPVIWFLSAAPNPVFRSLVEQLMQYLSEAEEHEDPEVFKGTDLIERAKDFVRYLNALDTAS